MDTVTRVQILDEADCILKNPNTFEKDIICENDRTGCTLKPWLGNQHRKKKTLNSNLFNSP